MTTTLDCDDLVMGSGMAGLAVAARLAHAGRRVLVVEAHDTPGGYAHTFDLGRRIGFLSGVFRTTDTKHYDK